MKQQTMTVLFYLNKAKTNQKGVCPIYCRITFLKKRKQFSTGQYVNPKQWNSKSQSVSTKDLNCNYINRQLSLMVQSINNTFLKLQLQEVEFNVEDISNLYFGWGRKEEVKFVSYYNKYLAKIKKLIGKDIKASTFKKFEYVKIHLESFIQFKFKTKDILLKELEPVFLADFEYYLKTEKSLAQITINKTIQRLKRPIKEAVSEGYLGKDPFMLHKAKTIKTRVVFLTPEELQIFENFTFLQPRLQLVKDLFIFSCYTGLAYNELFRLEDKHIKKGFDGNLWIKMTREKTSKELSIPLLPKALNVLDKYSSDGTVVFPKISNQKYNSYLKEIGEIIGIEKRLTTHMARRTFASTVLLYNDVPMEVVSELLGHSNMKITQDSYGKVVQKKISLEMERLKGSG